MDPSLLSKLGFQQAPRAQSSGSSSVIMPDPQQPGFWNTVFGSQFAAPQQHQQQQQLQQPQPAGNNAPAAGLSGLPLPFTFSSAPLSSLQPVQNNSINYNGATFPPGAAHRTNSNDSGSTSNHQASTSPNALTGSAPIRTTSNGSQSTNNGNTEKGKKTRKRQQTSCSACHRRKQKCNQQIPCDRCIKRGTADACMVMPAGDQGNPLPPQAEEEVDSPPSTEKDKRKRKRKNEGGTDADDLAARVQQLEDIIRMTQIQNGQSFNSNGISPPVTSAANGNTGSNVYLTGLQNGYEHLSKPEAADSPSEAGFSVKSETSAVEEAAVAALGQLSKAKPNEGGDESRIYNGPGSVTAFLSASAFGKVANFEDRYRARPSDLYLYSGVPSIHNLATPLGPRMTRLTDALAEQKAKLLPPDVCHYLWNFYYSCPLMSGRHRNFPRSCLQRAYDAIWEREEDKDMSHEAVMARSKNHPQLASANSLAFMSLCFVKFAISLSLAPGASAETAVLSATMYEASRSALMASEQREQPTYSVIAALFSQTLWLKLAGCPSFGFTYVAQAIRFAQSMGLHREPGPKWELGAFEAEIRRRVWWSLAAADKGHSIAYGRPYSIFDRHCDVEWPANIHEKDLTPDGPTNVRPLTEITEQTASLISIRMSSVIAEIIDRAFSCKTATYSTILELDAMLTKTEAECIPDGFRNPSLSDLAEKPYLRGAYTEIQIQLCWMRSILHRPYLLQKLPKPGEPDHYAGSRALTIMLSQKILGMNKEILNQTPENLKSYFGFAFNCFEPGVNLSMAIMQAPDSPTNSILDQYVVEAIDMLEKLSSINKVAVEGHESLVFMREKYLKSIEKANTSSKSSSTSGPSPGSLAYTSTSSGTSPMLNAEPSPAARPFAPAPPQQPEAAPTPNTLFNQFFSNLSGPSPASNPTDQMMDPATTDIEKLFNFDSSIYRSDPDATWLTQPIDGGLEAWPLGMPRLEGETDFGDWAKMLGF